RIWTNCATPARIASGAIEKRPREILSGSAIELIHRKLSANVPSAPSDERRIAQNRPKKIGICSSRGRQPAAGLMLYSEYSFIVSCERRWRSLPYFFCSSLILGCSACMAAVDLTDLIVRG